MSLAQFVSLLEKKALFFSKPVYFRDSYEGSFSKYDVDQILRDHDSYLFGGSDFQKKIEWLKKYITIHLEHAAVNCWHINEEESAAMWDIYLKSNEGLAIKTTFGNLRSSFVNPRFRIHVGKVQYIDFNKDMASTNVFESLFYKRKSFKYEQELRLLVLSEDKRYFSTETGTYISVDINKLIGSIHVSPTSPGWFKEIVESLTHKYGLEDKPVIQSDLYSDPLY